MGSTDTELPASLAPVLWTDVSKDPVSPEVHQFLLQETRAKKRVAGMVAYPDFLRERIAGRSVLDIGMVEHDLGHMSRVDWLHDIIREGASETLGIDIVEEGITLLAARGYDVALVDATSDVDLGRRFDVVHIGDVIEHVDNPVALLRFAGRHLADGGSVIVHTPNPWWLKYILRNCREGVLVANAEHVAWITPTLALELARRSGLLLEEYWLLRGRSASNAKRVLRVLTDRLFGAWEVLAPDFTYVLVRSV